MALDSQPEFASTSWCVLNERLPLCVQNEGLTTLLSLNSDDLQVQFCRAWEEYQSRLKDNNKHSKIHFIEACFDTASKSTGDIAATINQSMVDAENKHSQRASRRIICRYLGPVVQASRALHEIINVFCELLCYLNRKLC